MNTMNKLYLAATVAALMLTACGGRTNPGSVDTDSVAEAPSDTIDAIGGDVQHTETYIRSRIDSIYSDIKGLIRNDDYMGSNHDSLYCSAAYNTLLQQGIQLSEENGFDGYFLGYDHWVVGQDFSPEWDYTIQTIHDITDTTAVAEVTVKNCDEHRVQLDLVFEHGNWFVDDFHFPEHHENSKEGYSERAEMLSIMQYYRDNPSPEVVRRKTLPQLEGYWGWVGDDVPELLLKLELKGDELEVTECNVYRMYGFDHAYATFDGETLDVFENHSHDINASDIWLELHLKLDERGDLTGPYRFKHPLSNGIRKGTITLRKGYFKYE